MMTIPLLKDMVVICCVNCSIAHSERSLTSENHSSNLAYYRNTFIFQKCKWIYTEFEDLVAPKTQTEKIGLLVFESQCTKSA